METPNDTGGGGIESLRLLKSAEPPLYLSPSENLSQAARAASEYIFSSLKPYTPKTPFDRLLVDGFDAEQIWQQIDLQSQPLISSLRRELKRFEKNPEEISKLFGVGERKEGRESEDEEEVEREGEGFEELDDEGFDDAEEGEEESEEGEEESGEEEEVEEDGEENGVEDKFLKIKELEEYLEEDEAREYGTKKEKKKGSGKLSKRIEDGEEEEDEDEDEEESDGVRTLFLSS